MKNRTSKLLAAVITHLDKPRRETAADRRFSAWLANYPFGFREPLYCWLWANHAQVLDLRTRLDGPTWKGIATIITEDKVKGTHGEPPNANSVRRVWGRVCRDMEASAKRKEEYDRQEARKRINGMV